MVKPHRLSVISPATKLPFPGEPDSPSTQADAAATKPKPQQKPSSKTFLDHIRLRTLSNSKKDGKSSSAPSTPRPGDEANGAQSLDLAVAKLSLSSEITPDGLSKKEAGKQGEVKRQMTPAAEIKQADAQIPTEFGSRVYIFSPDQSMSDIQAQVDEVFSAQETNQFGSDRFVLLFMPGKYQLDVKIGYYTTVHGLGRFPEDTIIEGAVRVKADWMENSNATLNFWRGAENLTVIPTIEEDQKILVWAVSQATFFRRISVQGNVVLSDHGGWSSGGFIADCKVSGNIDNGTQQQFITRNTSMGSWTGGSYAQVFVGDEGAPPEDWPAKPFSTIKRTPVLREKPYPIVNEKGTLQIVVPQLKLSSVGPSWVESQDAGCDSPPADVVLDLSSFYIASPLKDTASTINAALDSGKSIVFSPGVYPLDQALAVTQPNTILLGIGLATLRPENGTAAVTISDVDGVTVSGLLLDAGFRNSANLITVGDAKSALCHSHNPIVLHDIFCRVGGAGLGRATTCMTINARDTIVDNTWIWRADHGEGVGWYDNQAAVGLLVEADDVTIYGLFVEHFQQYQTVWNGERGQVFFYQSEFPYDPPNNAVWSHSRVPGYASYKVAPSVKSHFATGLGIYAVFVNGGEGVVSYTAVEQPVSDEAYAIKVVLVRHVSIVRFAGKAGTGVNHVINGLGKGIGDNTRLSMLKDAYSGDDQTSPDLQKAASKVAAKRK
ncbi:hypothetical protein IE81DRAFT_339966 [Ceraceosorus guamensis]|uniref:Uncharacterized protein n=1 Tax=Ceraceosorus guamensis TaxID=1522189 RepID=A0A316W4A1_9BASI|nr:hypothetical protein IE81DRAFT_339966 [Ceraceosorus guamensis]PWN44522.1 hypothetical protein IE81DRAFT_339966 [Ceraceosorus guamensis]